MVYECKVATIWSIKKETFIQVKNYEYSEFVHTNIDGYKYNFWIEKRNGNVAIFIDDDDDDMKTTTVKDLTVTIPSANFEADLSAEATVPEGHEFYGWKNTVVLKHADILDPEKNFFVDDILTLEFRGTIEYTEKPEQKSLSQMLWGLGKDKDFTFIVETGKIKAHKLVLRRYSTVLAKLFDSNINQIEIKDFNYCTVLDCMHLCYEFKFKYYVNKLFECLRFADAYDMPIIKERIGHRLSDEINPKNVCEFANKSVELKCSTLKGYCIGFISKYLKEGTPYDGALDLNAEIVQEIYKSSVCDILNS